MLRMTSSTFGFLSMSWVTILAHIQQFSARKAVAGRHMNIMPPKIITCPPVLLYMP
jgi:hypothetical protein